VSEPGMSLSISPRLSGGLFLEPAPFWPFRLPRSRMIPKTVSAFRISRTLNVLVIRPPVSLRHVDGSPVRGLLWRLRCHRTRVPYAIPRSHGAERLVRDVGAPLIPFQYLAVLRMSSRSRRTANR